MVTVSPVVAHVSYRYASAIVTTCASHAWRPTPHPLVAYILRHVALKTRALLWESLHDRCHPMVVPTFHHANRGISNIPHNTTDAAPASVSTCHPTGLGLVKAPESATGSLLNSVSRRAYDPQRPRESFNASARGGTRPRGHTFAAGTGYTRRERGGETAL